MPVLLFRWEIVGRASVGVACGRGYDGGLR